MRAAVGTTLHSGMSATQNTYPISRPTGQCAATGRAIAVGETFIATLVERDDQPLLERMDFSVEAWDAGKRPGAPFRLFGSWKSVHQESGTPRQTLLSDPELLDLFEELGAATEPRQRAFRYLLALMLIRRRLLRLVTSTPEGLRVLAKGSAPETEPTMVIDPGLDDEMVAEAIEQLSQIMPQERAAIAEGAGERTKAGRRGR